MTVLLVEHDMEVVFRLARKITVLHRGAVIADGAPRRGEGRCRRAEGISRGLRLMLAIEGLNTHYGASHVLQGVDLAVPRRPHLFALLGRNGVGKIDNLAHGDGTGACRAADVWCWMAWTSPAGRRTASRVPASPMCRRGV